MMNKTLVVVVVMAGLFVLVGQAKAGTIFSDGFESYDVDTTAWLNSNASGENTVRNTPTVDSGQCLEVRDVGASEPYIYNNHADYTFVSDEYVQIDVYAQSKQTNENWGPVDIRGNGWNKIAMVYFNSSGTFSYYDGGWNSTTASYSADTNYHIRVILTPDVGGTGDTWKFYVDDMDTAVASGMSWAYNASNLDKYGVWGHGAQTAEGYIDSVNVQNLPEPATMILLGLGGVGLLIRRRRRA